MCDVCEDTNTLQLVYNNLGSVLGKLHDQNSNGLECKRKPSHQRSSVQPRFFSTHKKRKIGLKGLAKPGNEDIILSQETLYKTETEVCGMCFKEEERGNTLDVSWVSCNNCEIWVHTSCASVSSDMSTEYICQYCSTQS